jgi:hypothetical protein
LGLYLNDEPLDSIILILHLFIYTTHLFNQSAIGFKAPAGHRICSCFYFLVGIEFLVLALTKPFFGKMREGSDRFGVVYPLGEDFLMVYAFSV